ncbi:MAG: 2-oxoglutarate dehydrogenase E1 component, partial [Deltaproteobacteria bacterium]
MYSLDGVALANKDYVAEQYRRYQADPASVDERWAAFFAGFELANGNGEAPATLIEAAAAPGRVLDASDLVHSFRELGHLVAHLNPLEPRPMGHPLLDPAEFGFTEADMERAVDCGGFRGPRRAPLGELIERLRRTYCGTLGVEYLHIPDKEQREWLQERMEPTENRPELAAEDRIRVLENLLQAEAFEQFLQVRYPTAKRFSLEGGDSLIPMLDTLIEEAGTLGVEEIVFGMPHRGRLNVLANVIRKPYEMILAEFEGALLAREATGDGDVKYHLGYSRDHTTRAGHKVHLSLSANPSHLEAIDPVIEGMVRAKQDRYGDRERSRVVPVLLHGDA